MTYCLPLPPAACCAVLQPPFPPTCKQYAPGFQCCGKGPCNGLCCDCGGDACDPNCYGLTYSRHLLANPQPKLTRDEIFKQAAGSKNCIDLPAWTKWVESAKKAHMATTKTSDESSKRYTAVELFKK
jgi:hypothetical protein